jgi:hypothetical protein
MGVYLRHVVVSLICHLAVNEVFLQNLRDIIMDDTWEYWDQRENRILVEDSFLVLPRVVDQL